MILSPLGGGLSPLQGRRGVAPLYVNLEPQYPKTSSGIEVGEFMEGEGTTHVLHSVFISHCSLYMCHRMSDLAGVNFTNGV